VEGLLEIYGSAYFSAAAGETRGQGYADYLGEEPNHRANARARVRLLERYVASGRLLDVGCAAGFFLDEARQTGWDVEGVEVAAGMVAHARGLGLTVHEAPFAGVELEPGSFDAITRWDYIELSLDPAGDLRGASTLLRPGGFLLVSTGDARSAVARLSGRRWHLLTPRHHNFFFTRRSLGEAFRAAGLEVELMTYPSSLYSVHYLLYKLQTVWDSPRLERLAGRVGRTRLGSRAIPINLRDIVTVVGRRL
jgi:SAM-dependent methyltransferase